MKRPTRLVGWLLAPLAIAAIAMPSAPSSRADDNPRLGQQGVITGLPSTDSAVTVAGRGRFSGMRFTVNQTRNLNQQIVSVTWTGGVSTGPGATEYGTNFVQIMQCWGDDDGSNPANPGPPPEQCQFGAVSGVDGFNPAPNYPAGNATSRVIGARYYPSFDPTVGPVDASGGQWRPFRAVNGDVIGVHLNVDFNPQLESSAYWLNPYFNSITTNEVTNGRTLPSGTGTALFQVDTGPFSPGLGCGQKTQPVAGGDKKVPKCWLVIVPRGEAGDENKPSETGLGNLDGVSSSPLAPTVWTNRVAVPLEFNPVDSPCSLADTERRIVGSDAPLAAVSSWQPSLCTTPGLPPYSFSPVGDSAARQQVASSRPGSPGMALIGRPFDASQVTSASPAVYAPVAISGVVIGFNFERSIASSGAPPYTQDEAFAVSSTRVANVNLTPRLVAKLLTQSYRSQVEVGSTSPPYTWDDQNPQDLIRDPDFLQFNPEFKFFLDDTRLMGGLQLPAGNSDAARLMWEWVAADPEARAWMSGTPDAWGMKVNPAYAADASVNTTGQSFFATIPNSYPKADPFCFQAPPYTPSGGTQFTPPQLCGTDWRPYSLNVQQVAIATAKGIDGARIVRRAFPTSASNYWTRSSSGAPIGRRTMVGVVDTVSARQFGLQAARLSRAGDNGANRTFIAPDDTNLVTAVGSMKDLSGSGFLEPVVTEQAAGSYPLTLLTYAALKPLSLDTKARTDYAAFLDYAANDGQTPGTRFGQLPFGYTPLTDSLKSQTRAAADKVRTMTAPPTTTTVPPSTSRPATTVTSSRPPVTVAKPSRPTTGTSAPPVTETTVSLETEASTTTTVAPGPSTTVGPTTTVARPLTPSSGTPASRYAVVVVGALTLASALVALELTKRARKVPSSALPQSGSIEVVGGGAGNAV